MNLTERQKNIVKTLVEEFTRTAEPVGSKTLIPLLDTPVSSATIRNELAALEKMGLLEKTHASSGRIPSRLGYRYYVENLMVTALDPNTESSLKEIFSKRHGSIEDMIQTCCAILSEMTQLTSIVIGPEQGEQRLLKLQLIPISEDKAVAVFVTDTGHTEHRIFNFEQSVSIQDLKRCTDLLNDQLSGTALHDIAARMREIEPLMAAQISRHEVLFDAVVSAFMSMASSDAAVYGRANMLAQPEFTDPAKLANLMRALENTSLLHQWADSEGSISTPIGADKKLIQIRDCSVVSTRFETGPGEQGQLMVIGPNRMPYSRVVGLLDLMSRQIETLFARPKQGGSNDEHKQRSEKAGAAGNEEV